MKKINVFLMCLCSLLLFTGCYTNEFGENEENVDSKDGTAEILKEVANFVDEQTELEINAFQTNLLTWLKGNKNVKETTIGENKDLITVKLKNGYDFYINFQDVDFFGNDEIEQNTNSRTSMFAKDREDEIEYYNVSYQNNEEIIKSLNFLYAQTYRNMVVQHFILDFMDVNNAAEEKSKIKENIDKSPVNLNPDFTNDLKIMEKKWNDYGLIIITQTHGLSYTKGGFQIEDNSDTKTWANYRVINLYVRKDYIIKPKTKDNQNLYGIRKEAVMSKLKDCNTIYLGSYCWSYDLAKNHNGNKYTIIGNTNRSNYFNNLPICNHITSNLFSGLTLYEAYNTKPSGGWLDMIYRNDLKISSESKKRYFSISTDTITKTTENGQLIITGKINGYENLKKNDLTYCVYFHEGDTDFSPELTKGVECINLSTFKIDDDGKYSFEFPSLLKSNTKYRMALAFKYKDAIYYGERKTVTMEKKEEDDDIKAYLVKLYHDTDGDNWKYKNNWLSDKPVEEWYGIEEFNHELGLYDIALSNNKLNGNIDLSGCTSIHALYCQGNNLKSIDLSGCKNLSRLYCADNSLTSIDLSGCTSLYSFSFKNNNLISIDISDSGITTFSYKEGDLERLYASGCTKLVDINCFGNKLDSLNVTGCTALTLLYCYDNNLTSLNVSGCTALTRLYCSNNNLTSLNVSGCTALYDLYCSNNNLTSLDVSGCSELRCLHCKNNHIISEVPQYFDNLWIFDHDDLYSYYYDYKLSKTVYKRNDYGWYYPGEPESGIHGWSSSEAPHRKIKK